MRESEKEIPRDTGNESNRKKRERDSQKKRKRERESIKIRKKFVHRKAKTDRETDGCFF